VITVLVTRRLGSLLLPCMLLVDRTCLGIKGAFVGPAQTELEVERLRRGFASTGDQLRETDVLTAQSVIFHALDYSRSLGFAPHRDFIPELIGERPSALLDTPLARPQRPIYVHGPDDDVRLILARLDASVGPGNYDYVSVSDFEDDELNQDELDQEDDFDDDLFDEDAPEVLTVEGSEVSAEAPQQQADRS
jgi:hypothetical protein